MDLDGSPKRARKVRENDEFCSVKASIVLAVPPVFANRLRCGVEEMLDTMIMRYAQTLPLFTSFISSRSRRYEPTLNGVVLAHSDVHFLDRVARMQADSPFAICRVGFDALIWKPTRGMKLSGYHNSSGEGGERGLSPFSLSHN
jgi:DNA-directed RNA polymerase I subunit RPA43